MPPYYEDIGNDLLLESDIYSPEGVYDNQGVPYSPLLDSLIENIFHPEIGQNRHPFMDFVRMIESGEEVLMLPGETMGMTAYPEGNPEALAKNLYGEGQTAAGAYQFTEDTVDAAKNRAKQLGMTNEFLKTVSDDPTKWTSTQADLHALQKDVGQLQDQVEVVLELQDKPIPSDIRQDTRLDYFEKQLDRIEGAFYNR